MKIFTCQQCGHGLYFENTVCLHCQSALGYLSAEFDLAALKAHNSQWIKVRRDPTDSTAYRYCQNSQYEACNWLVPADANEKYCSACRLNQVIPNLGKSSNMQAWRELEQAKHRLVYSLNRLKLPIVDKQQDPQQGLAFAFLSDDNPQYSIQTGHLAGLITINIREADSVARESIRQKLGEPYRSLTGHFRHEIGHYYWDLLIKSSHEKLVSFRQIFGSETGYEEALQRYYQNGALANWQDYFISEYASAHPWEDWAETWAHYLHMIDALETAFFFGLSTNPGIVNTSGMGMTADFDPYDQDDFNLILANYLPMTYALNSINRGMGHQDLYPFVISPAVTEKIKFVHRLIKDQHVQRKGG